MSSKLIVMMKCIIDSKPHFARTKRVFHPFFLRAYGLSAILIYDRRVNRTFVTTTPPLLALDLRDALYEEHDEGAPYLNCIQAGQLSTAVNLLRRGAST